MGRRTEGPFARRLARPGVEEICELAGAFGFMAYHGGALEQQTDVIARAAAGAAGASLYAVVHPETESDHFPSTLVRPDESPALAAFIEHVDVVVTIHGFGRWGMFTSMLLGGRNRDLADRLAADLHHALPDYQAISDLDLIPPALRGQHPDNPVNLPRSGGVQLELPPRVRGLGPKWTDWNGDGLVPPAQALVDCLARMASSWQSAEKRS